jgi:hypothetical protein
MSRIVLTPGILTMAGDWQAVTESAAVTMSACSMHDGWRAVHAVGQRRRRGPTCLVDFEAEILDTTGSTKALEK